MDDTAQNPQIQQTQPNIQMPSVPMPVGQVPASMPQQPATQSSGIPSPSRHPEQGPAGSGLPPREAAPIDNAEAVTATSDDSATQPDEVSDAADVAHEATPDMQVQEAHPQVEIGQELKDAGVEQGKDADPAQLPEEQLVKTDEQQQQPDTQTAASGLSLATPPFHIEEVKKRSGIRDAIKWLAVSLIRQLKKMQIKPEEQKSTW